MSHKLANQTSGEVEWYTDPAIIEMAREVMGGIQLDPATSEAANRIVKAQDFFYEEHDGLSREWNASSMWMNHPFGIAERACDPKITGRPCRKVICGKRRHHRQKDYGGNEAWIRKLVDSWASGQVHRAICICFASMSEEWFRPLLAFPQCFPHGRVNYFRPDGTKVEGVTKGSVVTYLGPDTARFARVFSALGTIKVPYIKP